EEYRLANTRAIPVLHFNQVDDANRQAPPPFRTPVATSNDVSAIAGAIQLFDQAIKSTTAFPDITNLDPRINSDKQLKRVLAESKEGTSHYLDNLKRSIRYEGIILNDLLYPIYNRPGRIAHIMNPEGQ